MQLVFSISIGIQVCANSIIGKWVSYLQDTMFLFTGTNFSVFLFYDQDNTDLKAFCHFYFLCITNVAIHQSNRRGGDGSGVV